jgi:NADPH:quinone reductase
VRGFTLNGFDAAPALRDDLPTPAPDEEQVLVRVRASSVNPADGAVVGGMLRGMVEHEFPVVLGRDYAGVVEQVGSGVTRFREGDQVFGFVTLADPAVHYGSWTELIAVSEDNVAQAPTAIELSAAGAAPLAGIAAIMALDGLQVSDGDTVLIVGATGGVGSVAAQLATHAGASVIAPSLPEDEDFLRTFGLAQLVDRDADVAAAVRELHADGVDALLDLVSYTPDGFDAYAAALRSGGRAASTNGAAGDGAGRANIVAAPTPENLQRLARLLEDGTIAIPIQQIYPLTEAGDALSALATQHTQGKLAIALA